MVCCEGIPADPTGCIDQPINPPAGPLPKPSKILARINGCAVALDEDPDSGNLATIPVRCEHQAVGTLQDGLCARHVRKAQAVLPKELGGLVNARHVDQLLTLARLCDVIRNLHTH